MEQAMKMARGCRMLFALFAAVIMLHTKTVAADARVLSSDSGANNAEIKTIRAAWQDGAGIAAVFDEIERGEEASAQDDAEWEKAANGSETDENRDGGAKSALQEDLTGTIVMADVNNVLNVRQEPDSSAELEGYLYADCGGTVLEQADGWTKIESGELVGWASNDYLLFGEEAQQAAEDAGRTVATTTTGALRIRKEPSLDAGVYDLLEEGAEYEVVNADQLAFSDGITITEDWVAVDYEGQTGFVSAEYVKIDFLIDTGETIEQVEIRKEEEAKAAAAAKKAARQQEVEKTKALGASDEVLLAALIQCEAGGDIYEGKVAVGAVVMNRVKSPAYPNTIKDVIFASGQFTPVGSGKVAKVISSGKINESCIRAAAEALAGASLVGSATHFRRAGGRDGLIVGAHVFW